MDARPIAITIPGRPVPTPRARVTRSGHAYTPDNGIKSFRAAVALAMRLAAPGRKPAAGCHAVDLEFVIDRPKSHLRSSGEVKPDARPHPGRQDGDWDNLAKGVCDAITDSGVVWLDDDQVVETRVVRRYAAPGELARTTVSVRRLPP